MAEKKGRVLCVDDEPNILRSLQWLLQREFEVQTAANGADALALIKGNDFDVVISDQRMPGMMGSELLREVRKLSPRAMRILLTGYSDLQAVLRSVNESEVFRFINKPWNTNELPRIVAEAAEIARNHPAVAAPAPDGGADAASSETILVIDDDPGMAQTLVQEVGAHGRVTHARNLAEAVAAFDEQDVGIIVSDTHVADLDTTNLLKLLKQEHPEVVTVVYTAAADAVDVITLINQGQIFRFIPKPVKPVTLKLALVAAMLKRRQLRQTPGSTRRHSVEDLGESARQTLLRNVQHSAAIASPSAAPAATGGSLLRRLGGGLRRLFGAG